MQITQEQLIRATGCSVNGAATWHPTTSAASWLLAINSALSKWGINTPDRVAHFLGQVAVESAGLSKLEEDLSYSCTRLMQVWPSRFKTLADARPYAANPVVLGNLVYGNRMGNTQPGDGFLYRGRGLLQLTGKTEYAAYLMAANVDALSNPDLLLQPQYAADSAGWYWSTSGCNALADGGSVMQVTKRINGGTTDLDARIAATKRALQAITT